ncbi:pentatricopeptide repeat domain-containing protein [Xylariaceae sp. FL0255]|nr:pentatricopeptide repeat domain-containing protein [Xylariaceae sp. FL0255]
MRSQLTRHVLRRPPPAVVTLRTLTSSARFITSSSEAIRPRSRPRVVPRPFLPTRIHKRSLFGRLFKKAPRALREVEAKPGYETLLAYTVAEHSQSRPPDPKDLLKAWRDFFKSKWSQKRSLNATQVQCAQRVLIHLASQQDQSDRLLQKDINLAIRCLASPSPIISSPDPSKQSSRAYLDLVVALYRQTESAQQDTFVDAPADAPLENVLRNPPVTPQFGKDLYFLLIALTRYGDALEAKRLFLAYLPTATDADHAFNLPLVASALARDGEEQHLVDLVSRAIDAGVVINGHTHRIMTCFYAERDNFEQTKAWFSTPIPNQPFPLPQTYHAVLQFALRNNQEAWALQVYENLLIQLESAPTQNHKNGLDVSFQWAYLLLRKGPDHIEQMFRVGLEHTKDNDVRYQPNMASIHALIRLAIDKDDPYMAERFHSMAGKLGFESTMTTYLLQIEYRMRAGDIEGALATFQTLKGRDASLSEMSTAILFQLIQRLCSASSPDYENILDITSYLEQRRIVLDPQTVVSICVAFLKNDEVYEVMDTLSLHTAYFSVEDRSIVCQAFVEYCLDPGNSTSRVWDAYALLRQFFPETPRDQRAAIMDAFFRRKRPDMATHVFGHMRAHENMSIRPSPEIYVRCLEGIGQCPDEESLRIIHNMLKMDTTIQFDTRMFNALMIGYIACNESHRALDYWKEITTSREGPSYATLEIVFRAYEVQPYGDELAKELWKKITEMELDVPEHVFSAYGTTLAAHSLLEDVKLLLQNAHAIMGKRPSVQSLAYVYNGLPSPELKDDFESWAAAEFLGEWEALKREHRRKKNEEGLTRFKISRLWKAEVR